jgi:hypothetical protein
VLKIRLKREEGISWSKKPAVAAAERRYPNEYRKGSTLQLDRASLGAVSRDVVRGSEEKD